MGTCLATKGIICKPGETVIQPIPINAVFDVEIEEPIEVEVDAGGYSLEVEIDD